MKNILKHILTAFTVSLFSVCAVAQTNGAASGDVNAIKMSKKATLNSDGSYTLELESYINGYISNSTSTVTTSVPLDVVLVLDVSGSMRDNISSTTYNARTSQSYTYDNYGNNTYYYKDGNRYYLVSRESTQRSSGDLAYTPLAATAEYTYNSYGSNEYYYLYNGNYYRVYRGRFSALNGNESNSGTYRRLYFTVNGTRHYLSGSGQTTTAPTNVTGNNATIYTGVLYEYARPYDYRLSYVGDGNQKFYLSGTTTTTTAPQNTSSTATIYTGILYTTQATTQSKMAALKVAVSNFIRTISAESTETTQHRIAIVKFAGNNRNVTGNDWYNNNSYNYSQIVMGLTDSKESSLLTTVESLNHGGATSADYGMEHAKTIINGITGDRKEKSAKLVVMFTDGEPNHGSGFDTSVATDAVKAAKDLKDKNVTVYSVGVFDNVTTNISNYMNRVSSNYLNATTYTNGTRTDTKYFMTATSADELNNVFSTISSEATSQAGEGEQYSVSKEDVVIKDIVTSSFVIPEGENKITFYTSNPTSIQPNDYREGVVPTYTDITWSELVETKDVTFTKNIAADGKTTIDVKGFDFSKNWVGYKDTYKEGVRTEHEIHGSKLVIKITVNPAPDAEGGYVSTNAEGSGFYVKDELIKGFVNPAPVATPMDMKITILNGPAEGKESVIFDVYNASNDKEPIVSVAVPYKNGSSSTITKLPVGTESDPIIYRVVPRDSWSYKYIVSPQAGTSNEKALFEYNSVTKEYTNTNVFNFEVTGNGDKAKTRGDESNKLNVFN